MTDPDDIARALAEAKRIEPRLAPFLDAIRVTEVENHDEYLLSLHLETGTHAVVDIPDDRDDSFHWDLVALAQKARAALCERYRVIDPDDIDPNDW